MYKNMKHTKNIKKKEVCSHDYKNAIKLEIGNNDFICPLCDEVLDRTEWFFMTHMESLGVKFIDVTPKNT